MAYQTYITEAIVCGSSARNTSDRVFLLFTREAGMLRAHAKSVREERSKQRFALQEFSTVRATLVHGRQGWRIAGVEPIRNLYSEAASREQRALIRNTVLLLRRVMQGEVSYAPVYDLVMHAITAELGGNLRDRERLLSLHILFVLGYVALEDGLEQLLPDRALKEIRSLSDAERLCCDTAIEHGLMQSQL
jgi:recombinational DNA repair protein (RecF pathway)